jgi:hypothetical protein
MPRRATSERPVTSGNLNVIEGQIHQQQFQDILAAFNELSEWVDKNFSDVEFNVEFNDDSQNPVHPRFIIKTRLFTGMDMTPNDRLLKKNAQYITPEVFSDPMLMAKWIKNIVPSYKASITKEVNDWYNRHQEKLTV